MKRNSFILTPLVSLGLLLLVWGGCREQGAGGAAPAGQPVPAQPTTDAERSTEPQPKLPTVVLWVGSHRIEAEVADRDATRQMGMMWRKQIPENEGMLFVFPYPHRTSFWMKNTIIPLDAAYIGTDGTILEIHAFQPLNENPVPASTDRIQYVLEMAEGWFARNGVAVGTLIATEQGGLAESFSGSSRPKR